MACAPQFGRKKWSVILIPTAQDRIQEPSDLLQREKHQPTQMQSPDPFAHARERLRNHRWEEARENRPIAVPGHAWSETEAEKRDLDLMGLP